MLLSGSGLVNVHGGGHAARRHRPGLALVRRPQRPRRSAPKPPGCVAISDAGGGRAPGQCRSSRSRRSAGAALEVPATVTVPPGGAAQIGVTRARPRASAAAGDNYGFILLRRGDRPCASSRTPSSSRGRASRRSRRVAAAPVPGRQHRRAASRRRASTASRRSRSGRRRTTSASRWTRRAPRRSTSLRVNNAGGQRGRRRDRLDAGRADPSVAARLPGRERRAGLPGHAGERELAHLRLPAPTSAPPACSSRGRGRYFVALDSGSDEYTGRSFAGELPAPSLAERRAAAADPPAHDPGRRRPLAHRRARAPTRAPASTRPRS